MRAVLDFDPREYDYGPATAAVRTIMLEYAEIDWFAPPRAGKAEARRLFREHNALAHAVEPDMFAERVEVECVAGDWSRFVELCTAVRNTGWDWKISILKQLSSGHAEARGWRYDEQGVALSSEVPRPGDLFTRYTANDGSLNVFWNPIGPGLPELDALPAAPGESARFYYGYAHADILDCIKWQLAERSDDRTRNAFRPLMACYRAGFYPFSFDRSTVTLFGFAAGSDALPRATLLPKRARRGLWRR